MCDELEKKKTMCDLLVLLLQSKLIAQIYLLCIFNKCKAEIIFDLNSVVIKLGA